MRKTLQWYAATPRRWVLPTLEDLRLRDISPLNIHQLYQGLFGGGHPQEDYSAEHLDPTSR